MNRVGRAAIMLTVPNTLGVFEHQIVEISRLVHDRGGFIYMDGANLNSFVGRHLLYDGGGAAHVDDTHVQQVGVRRRRVVADRSNDTQVFADGLYPVEKVKALIVDSRLVRAVVQ